VIFEMHDARVERLGKGGKSSDSCALCAKGHKEGELKSSSGDGCQMISFWSFHLDLRIASTTENTRANISLNVISK